MNSKSTQKNDTGLGASSTPSMSDELLDIVSNPAGRKLFNTTMWAAVKKIPIAGDILEITGEALIGLADMERDYRRKRLEDYIRGVALIRREELDIREDDLLAAIRRVIQDDEAGKAEYYARLTVRMVENNVTMDEKLHFLSMLSELTCFQIDYGREFYIRDTVPLCGYTDCSSAVSEFVSQGSGRKLRARSNLVNWGLLEEEQLVAGLDGASGIVFRRTEDLDKLMTFLFHEDDRQPNVIGKKFKAAFDVIIINHLRSSDDLYPIQLCQRLKNAGLTVDIVDRDTEHNLMKTARLYVWNNFIRDYSSGHEKEQVQIQILDEAPLVGGPKKACLRSFSLESGLFNKNFNKGRRYSGSNAEVVSVLDQVADNLIATLKDD